MQFSSILIAAVSLALAQAKIAFTTLPSAVEAGKPTTLKWTGGDNGEPVTITLRKGLSSNLQTIAILTSDAKGNSYTWTPSKSLANADDYALQISQGVDDSNYTGEISLSGGSSAAASSYSVSSAASTSASASSSASATSETTVIVSANSTTSRSHTVYMTGTAPIVTGPASASGTGINVSRNTTFSSATPTRSSSGGLVATTTSAATTTSGSGSGSGSSTTSGAASSSSSGAASRLDLQVGAGFAAILGLAAML
ncbi:MAG: hypothetical protein MMC23_009518 [Stictis urceolatum]|nr:hypothetical protein [Stictis urceolata]